MEVTFKRTGERRYAVIVALPGQSPRWTHPAPGYDEHIPHDLVHYVVEAELGLRAGVFGRAESGGGGFLAANESDERPRARARQRRKQRRRENSLRSSDEARRREMSESERLAATCDLAWRRRNGQRPDPARWREPEPLSAEDAPRVEHVLARLDRLAPLWSQLPIGAELRFVWPSTEPLA